jgi:hypothetical protein
VDCLAGRLRRPQRPETTGVQAMSQPCSKARHRGSRRHRFVGYRRPRCPIQLRPIQTVSASVTLKRSRGNRSLNTRVIFYGIPAVPVAGWELVR